MHRFRKRQVSIAIVFLCLIFGFLVFKGHEAKIIQSDSKEMEQNFEEKLTNSLPLAHPATSNIESFSPLNNFLIIDTDTIEASYEINALKSAERITYIDPKTGIQIVSNTINLFVNSSSISLTGSVSLSGLTLPMTITIGANSVFMTLPYTNGILNGEGRKGKILLKKAKSFKDDISELHTADINPTSEIQERLPKCLNC